MVRNKATLGEMVNNIVKCQDSQLVKSRLIMHNSYLFGYNKGYLLGYAYGVLMSLGLVGLVWLANKSGKDDGHENCKKIIKEWLNYTSNNKNKFVKIPEEYIMTDSDAVYKKENNYESNEKS